jgi:hypothetical protein
MGGVIGGEMYILVKWYSRKREIDNSRAMARGFQEEKILGASFFLKKGKEIEEMRGSFSSRLRDN